jgi:hypothetical protein
VSDFDLRALVREILDSSPATDPATLAKEVAARVERRDVRAALEQAMPALVSSMVTRARSTSPGGHLACDPHATPAAGGNPSRKVAAIREWWQQRLAERISVGSDPSAWKFLGDCTAPDLEFAASVREDRARSHAARAAEYRGLAAALRDSGSPTVRDLPDLAERLSDAA